MRIYVSSTSLDLKDYREAVIDAILRLGHVPVAMEYYTAQPVKPVDKCLEDVSGCDLYIGLFAFRYGFIPPDLDKSISELEYRRAVDEEIPTLIFLLDENINWPSEFIDRGSCGDQIQSFRETLKKSCMVSFFRSPEDLCAKVTAALALIPPSSRPLKIIGLPPADVSEKFRDRVDKILELKSFLGKKALKLICIVGRGGIGKTWLLSKMCQDIQTGEAQVPATVSPKGIDGIVYLDCKGEDRVSVELIYHRLSALLRKSQIESLKACWNDPSLTLNQKVRTLLSTLNQGCYLLVLDNFEETLTPDNTIKDPDLQTFLELCLITPHALRILATSRENVVVPNGFLAAQMVEIEGLPEVDAIAMLRDLDPENKLGIGNASEELLREAVKRCFGIPRALQNLAGLLLTDRTRSFQELIKDKSLFTEQVLENLIKEHFQKITPEQQRLLQTLAVFNHPVPRGALEFVLAPFLTPEAIRIALNHLVQAFFVIRQVRKPSQTPPSSDTASPKNTNDPSPDYVYNLHSLDREFAYAQIPVNQKRALGFTQTQRFTRKILHYRTARYYLSLCTPQSTWQTWEDLESAVLTFKHLVNAHRYNQAYRWLESFAFDTLWLWGYYEELCELLERLLPGLKNPMLRCRLFLNMGYILWGLGRLEESLQMYSKTLKSWSLYSQPKNMMTVFGNVGLVYSAMGELRKALKYQKLAVYSAKLSRDDPVLCFSLSDLAITYRFQGKLKESMALAERAATLSAALRDYRVLSNCQANLGLCSLLKGQWSEAENHFTLGKAAANQVKSSAGSIFNLWGLSQCAMLRHDYAAGLSICAEARKADFPLGRHYTSLRLGIAYRGLGSVHESQEAFKECIERCSVLLNHCPRDYDALYVQSLAQSATGEQEAAKANLEAAVKICPAQGIIREALLDLKTLSMVMPDRSGLEDLEAIMRQYIKPD